MAPRFAEANGKGRLNRPLAVVTGGSRGIGRAIVTELARTHRVVATYRSNRAAADAVSEATGCTMLPCDIGSLESCRAFADQVDAPDLLVNNAGIAPRERSDILNATPDSFEEIIATNLRGPYFLTQHFARKMTELRSGRIVFITSISSFTASTNRGDYCISKAGLSMAAKLFAARLAEFQIPVFEIEPGIIRTDMIAAVAQTYEQRIASGLLPQRRIGEPEDVARAVRAIADGLLDYATGQVLHIDGGFHLRTL